ncbi:PLP-dependent cysteine synthase family protein [Thermococcus sp. 21S9]|uniref:PLP-dependent cysteine synthase family protein n=1 Tax=Thermococcus sp. 21S9 TaxID=1638223 RepID=UPI00143AF317|nr:pyridoxal-phosphate dependent enzyme [Thermococcus sp. 21S9]NJE53842.1 pyridoxal-phosphate dependent enzyme [Thermococcus sp. 21S9]
MSFAKLEFFNPFSRSIKDRTAYTLLFSALENGNVGSVFEASSGNTAIALASLSNVLGVKFRAYLPRPTPKSTRVLLSILGAEVVLTDFETIDREMVEFVREEAGRSGALNLNQYENENNFLAHRGTGREIAEQLESIGKRPELLIAGIGTSGHIAGIGSYLKERYGTRVVGVVPARGERIPGIKGLDTGPKWVDYVDEVVEVTLEEAVAGVREVARLNGILVGLSSGAVYRAMKELKPEGTTVLIFPDDGFKYVEIFEKFS